MASYVATTSFIPNFFDDNGNLLSGGTLEAFIAGTSTPTGMFVDEVGTAAGTVITLNARGEPETTGNSHQVWIDSAIEYDFILKDSSGVTINTPQNVAAAGRGSIAAITTVAVAKALTTLSDGQGLYIQGYTVVGDGGGGIYHYDASSTATANDGTILALDTLAGRLIYSDVAPATVKTFGAKGDDVANDSVAITTASDVGVGSDVDFPPGIYRVDNVQLGSTNLRAALGSVTIKLFGASTAAFAVKNDNVTISGFVFDLDNTANAQAIISAGGSNVTIKNNKFTNHTMALHINAAGSNYRFTDNYVEGGAYGVLVNQNANGSGLDVSHNTFDGLSLTTNRDAVEINLPTGSYPYITISNNIIRNYDAGSASSGFGIGGDSPQHMTITGNVIDNCGYQGIHLEDDAKYITISNNVISNTGGGTSAPVGQQIGISMVAGYYNVIESNIIYNSVDDGIQLSGATVGRHNSVTNNHCYENGGHGIFVSTARFLRLESNNCKNNAGSGIYMTSPARTIISRNFCYNENNPAGVLYTQVNGLEISGTASNCVISDNVCYDNSAADFVNVDSSASVLASNNDFLDSATQVATRTYTATNVSADRSYDANATTTNELADVVGTLIADLQEKGLIS